MNEEAKPEESQKAEPKKEEPKKKEAAGNPALKWGIRIVVFGALGALLVLAGLQFYAKRQMESSMNAIADELRERETKPLSLKEAEDLMQGDWEASDTKTSGLGRKKIYTWSGPFSEHRLAIYYQTNPGGNETWVEKASTEVGDIE